MTTQTAFVIRATGSQGKATTTHLLKNGWQVNAFVRDLDDTRALALQHIGARLYKGTLDDPSAIEAAIIGCSAVFLSQYPSFVDPHAEAREAASVIELARKAGVRHIVHTTSLGLSDPDMKNKVSGSVVAPAILGKIEVEKLVRESGMTWTILRPSYFMSNFTLPLVTYMHPNLYEGRIETSFKPDTILPLISPDDIGAFAAAAFQDPERYAASTIAVVGESMTMENIVKEIEAVTGKVNVHYRTDEETAEEIKKDNPMTTGQLTTIGMHELFDMKDTTAWGIPLTSFRSFLEKNMDLVVPNRTRSFVTGASDPVVLSK